MHAPDLSAITVDRLPYALHADDIIIDVLRLDKIHPLISGNKWFKLHNYLVRLKETGKKRIVTFGGAWSNHIIATAAMASLNGIPATGLIRGEEPQEISPVLKEALELGMQLLFLDREDYKNSKLPSSIDPVSDLVIPQGGYGVEGMRGAIQILDHCEKEKYTHICCAVGTGTMMAGLINSCPKQQVVMGFSVMKNNYSLQKEMEALLESAGGDYQIDHSFHFGGFGKHPPALLLFMNQFYEDSGIPTDIVYTAKVFYGVLQRSREGFFPKGSRILVIHSGGLTGNRSLGKGTLIFPVL